MESTHKQFVAYNDGGVGETKGYYGAETAFIICLSSDWTRDLVLLLAFLL